MKLKTIVTIILMLFVMTSIAYLVVEEVGKKRPGDINKRDIPEIDASPGDESEHSPETAAEDMIIVYYFHGNFRCHSCLTIEQLTRDAVLGGFEEELQDGRLALRIINMQDPLNRTYVEDFQLEYYMVVLERIGDGERQDWKKLEDVWDLYMKEDLFIEYVQEETRDFLKEI